MSVAMAKMAAEDGTTHLVATPHCNYQYPFDVDVNQAKIDELQAAVGESPTLLMGCDFHLSYDNIRQLLDGQGPFTINRSKYLLIELDEHFVPQQFDNVLYDIQVAGFIPILTHPERNPVFVRHPALVSEWVMQGCLVQVTAQSYTGGLVRRPSAWRACGWKTAWSTSSRVTRTMTSTGRRSFRAATREWRSNGASRPPTASWSRIPKPSSRASPCRLSHPRSTCTRRSRSAVGLIFSGVSRVRRAVRREPLLTSRVCLHARSTLKCWSLPSEEARVTARATAPLVGSTASPCAASLGARHSTIRSPSPTGGSRRVPASTSPPYNLTWKAG